MTQGSASQNERVLAQLRKGPLDAVDFQPPNVCDGGKPIWRVAARVGVLKDRGFVILSERLGDGSARYRLVGEPERAATDDTQRPSPAGRLGPNATRSNPSPTGAVTARGASELSSPAESHPVGGSLFDASVFAERGGYENSEAA